MIEENPAKANPNPKKFKINSLIALNLTLVDSLFLVVMRMEETLLLLSMQ